MARVLVIDDDPGLLELMGLILKRDNLEMIPASDGGTGIERFSAEMPDLVIVDAAMPDMDGFGVAEHIRASDEQTGRHTPIIMLTAYGNESHKQRGAEIGVDRYLVKPIKPKDLLVYVNDLLGQSGEQT